MPTNDAPLEIRQFDPATHDKSSFDCGNEGLNNYIQRTAKKAQAGDMVRVYVVLEQGQSQVLGYYSINPGTIDATKLEKKPRGTPSHGKVPVMFLGMIARDLSVQGQGIGELLMQHAIEKTTLTADAVGFHAMILDINDGDVEGQYERLQKWYEDFGFVPLPSEPGRMIVTTKQLRALTDRRVSMVSDFA